MQSQQETILQASRDIWSRCNKTYFIGKQQKKPLFQESKTKPCVCLSVYRGWAGMILQPITQPRAGSALAAY